VATSTYGTPYVQGSDLVSAYPTVSSSLATRVDEVSYKGNGLNAQTGTTYTLVAGDAGKTITLSNASPVAVTLPQDSTADLPDGAIVAFYNLGAGVVTISQGTGATLNGGSITLAQYEVTSLIKLSANTYGRYDGAPAPGLSQVTPTSIANSGGTATLTGGAVVASAVTTVSLNGVFTDTYDNYRILIQATNSTVDTLRVRYRLSGTDASGTDYYNRMSDLGATYVTTGGAATSALLGKLGTSGNRTLLSCDLGGVRSSQNKTTACFSQDSAGTTALVAAASQFSLTSAYDGITIFPSSGALTATIRVYGYRN
jgi:hypothetical protein